MTRINRECITFFAYSHSQFRARGLGRVTDGKDDWLGEIRWMEGWKIDGWMNDGGWMNGWRLDEWMD